MKITSPEWIREMRENIPGIFSEGERAIILHYLWMLEAALERWNSSKPKE